MQKQEDVLRDEQGGEPAGRPRTRAPEGAAQKKLDTTPTGTPRTVRRPVPLVRFFGYYVLLALIGAALVRLLPEAARAFVSPIADAVPAGAPDVFGVPSASPQHFETPWERSLTTALMTIGTLALVLPIAWVYMFTRRFRYDRALVQSVIILPLVVGGMVMIVKNSLALAFSLAGIVAAVRFRNTLKDPRDAVYIFLALGIGLAAGVQALDIGYVMSLSFNIVVLGLWRWNLGAVYGADRRSDMLAMGEPTLRRGATQGDRRLLASELAALAEGKKYQGALLLQGPDLASIRAAGQAALAGNADDWSFQQESEGSAGNVLLPILVKFKKKGSPVEVLGELDEYWTKHVASAEYIPFAKDEG